MERFPLKSLLCFHRSGPPANYFLEECDKHIRQCMNDTNGAQFTKDSTRVSDVYSILVLYALLYLFAKKRL